MGQAASLPVTNLRLWINGQVAQFSSSDQTVICGWNAHALWRDMSCEAWPPKAVAMAPIPELSAPTATSLDVVCSRRCFNTGKLQLAPRKNCRIGRSSPFCGGILSRYHGG